MPGKAIRAGQADIRGRLGQVSSVCLVLLFYVLTFRKKVLLSLFTPLGIEAVLPRWQAWSVPSSFYAQGGACRDLCYVRKYIYGTCGNGCPIGGHYFGYSLGFAVEEICPSMTPRLVWWAP